MGHNGNMTRQNIHMLGIKLIPVKRVLPARHDSLEWLNERKNESKCQRKVKQLKLGGMLEPGNSFL